MNRLIIRPYFFTKLFVAALICWFLSLCSTYIFFVDWNEQIHDSKFIWSYTGMFLISVFMLIHFVRSRIIVDETDYIHEGTFKTFIFPLKEISKIEVREYIDAHSILNQYQFIITSNNKTDLLRFESFRKKDLLALAMHLKKHCAHADYNLLFEQMSLGKMPAKF